MLKGNAGSVTSRRCQSVLVASIVLLVLILLQFTPSLRVLWGPGYEGAPSVFFGADGECDGEARLMGDGEENLLNSKAGGWWVCWPKEFKANKDNCKVLSWGIQNVFSFDEEMAASGCEVHGFDPSPLGLSIKDKYNSMGGIYHNYGLGRLEDYTYAPGMVPFRYPGMGYLKETNTYPWRLKNIPTSIQDTIGSSSSSSSSASSSSSNSKRHPSLTILKIDVEGTEWDIMDQLTNVDWDLLMIELHWEPKVHHLIDAGDMRGFVVTRLPGSIMKKTFKRPDIDYIDLWSKLTKVGDIWRYHFNPRDRLCLEVYLKRRRTE
jgi:hypothetical protein